MTTLRRLPLIAVCIASASLLATQPALAGQKVVEETARQEAPAETLPSLTDWAQKIIKFLKEMQQTRTESTTVFKKG